MKRILIIISLLFMVSSTASAQITGEDIDRISLSVVKIISQERRDVFTGTGTIISPDGLIFTNRHVVDEGDEFFIMMLDDLNEQPVFSYVAVIDQVFDDIDFAILRIVEDAFGNIVTPGELDLPFIETTVTTPVRRGDRLFVFGYPGTGDGYLVMTDGSVTTIQNGQVGSDRMPVWVQTNAEISPGNSGGLAVNERGEVVGMPTAVNFEDDTGGRLGGILPFETVNAYIALDAGITVTQESNDTSNEFSNTPNSAPNNRIQGNGIVANCRNGIDLQNGVEIIVRQIRPNFEYKATVIGLNDFDPILAVQPSNDSGDALCSDDDDKARDYGVSLPTVGFINATSTSSQVTFSNTSTNLMDVSFIVGEYSGLAGEFLLILEGMSVTASDSEGDPYSVIITPNVVNANIPISVYMIGKETQLDPLMYTLSRSEVLYDRNGDAILCDDVNLNCWGNPGTLDQGRVETFDQTIISDLTDAMLSVPIEVTDEELTFVMSSFNQETSGEYIVVFHLGIR